MGADGSSQLASAAASPAPLTLLQLWLDCRCFAVEWQGAPPAAAAAWAGLLQTPSRDAAGALHLSLGPQRYCRLLAVGETDCYAWEALLAHCGRCAVAVCPGVDVAASPLCTRPVRRELRNLVVDIAGRLGWEDAPARCQATRRWLAAVR